MWESKSCWSGRLHNSKGVERLTKEVKGQNQTICREWAVARMNYNRHGRVFITARSVREVKYKNPKTLLLETPVKRWLAFLCTQNHFTDWGFKRKHFLCLWQYCSLFATLVPDHWTFHSKSSRCETAKYVIQNVFYIQCAHVSAFCDKHGSEGADWWETTTLMAAQTCSS